MNNNIVVPYTLYKLRFWYPATTVRLLDVSNTARNVAMAQRKLIYTITPEQLNHLDDAFVGIIPVKNVVETSFGKQAMGDIHIFRAGIHDITSFEEIHALFHEICLNHGIKPFEGMDIRPTPESTMDVHTNPLNQLVYCWTAETMTSRIVGPDDAIGREGVTNTYIKAVERVVYAFEEVAMQAMHRMANMEGHKAIERN